MARIASDAERQSMAEWWQSSARLTCKAEKLGLRASLLPKALLWKESLCDDFCTLWTPRWVITGLSKLPCFPGAEARPPPEISPLEPGLRELNPAPLRRGVGQWDAQNSALGRCTLSKHGSELDSKISVWRGASRSSAERHGILCTWGPSSS